MHLAGERAAGGSLHGLVQHQPEVGDADPELERCAQPVCHLVRRAGADGRPQLKLTYTDCLELSEILFKQSYR